MTTSFLMIRILISLDLGQVFTLTLTVSLHSSILIPEGSENLKDL